MPTLRDVAKWLEGLKEREAWSKTICLRAPWTADSEARVVVVDEEGRIPPDALSDGFEYFLEASVALEVLEVPRHRQTKPTTEDACRLLIYYAENDAHPDWAYK